MRANWSNLTLVALIAGIFVGVWMQGKTRSQLLNEGDFLREAERGTHMPLIAISDSLQSYITDLKHAQPGLSPSITNSITTNDALVLKSSKIIIPDSYAASFFGCTQTSNQPWFLGQLEAKSEAFKSDVGNSTDNAEDHHLGAQFRATGSLYRCDPSSKRKILVASGISISAPIHPPSLIEVTKTSAWSSYTGFVANLYLTFLLMLFLPTLAISLLKAIIESAQSVAKFRYAFAYFVGSSLIAALVGGVAGFSYGKFSSFKSSATDFEMVARSLGGTPISADYDPNPVLTQLSRIIPANPIGALTDPSGNSGLQIAFIAVIIGTVFASMRAETRRNISDKLKGVLAVIIRDPDLKWNALSDYAEFLAPIGVFFLTATTFSTIDFNLMKDLASLLLIIGFALVVHLLVVFVWLNTYRNSSEWLKKALIPGWNAILTAFATASSYAALPSLSAVPLFAEDAPKRGILDLGTTLNKNGTAAYLAASAAFLGLHHGALTWHDLVPIVLLAAVAGTVIAGLPFAAVFGLQMILVSLNLPGGLAWLILPIDPIADRLVTSVNVISNLAACSNPKR